MKLHCILYQHLLCGTTLKSEHVVLVVNFIWSYGLPTDFNLFCWEFMLNVGMSCTIKKFDDWVVGLYWNIFLVLRLEIEMLMNEKQWWWNLKRKVTLGNGIAVWYKPSYKWIKYLTSSQQKLISNVFGAVTTSEMKLELFQKQFENVSSCHLSSCELLHKDGTVNVPFPSVCVVVVIGSLAENFEMKFAGFL